VKTSFTTLGCPGWSLEQIAKNAQAFGYQGVELRTHTDGNHFSPDAPVEEALRAGTVRKRRRRRGGERSEAEPLAL